MTVSGALVFLLLVLLGGRLLRFLAWTVLFFLLGVYLLGTHLYVLDPTRLLWFLFRGF